MGEIWVRYGWDMGEKWGDMGKIWVRYGWDMDEIWVRYRWNMDEIWVRYGWDTHGFGRGLSLEYIMVTLINIQTYHFKPKENAVFEIQFGQSWQWISIFLTSDFGSTPQK